MTTWRRAPNLCRALGIALAVAATAWQAGCHESPSPPPHPEAAKSTPVPPPNGLVVDLCARGPDALWGRLKQGFGTPAAVLPQTIGGALATVAKLDLTLAGEVDGAAPAFGVVARPDKTYGWVAALRLRDIAHARAALLEGKTPRFVGRAGEGDLTILDLAPSGDFTHEPGMKAVTCALSPLGYLVVASSEASLLALAPYATRTLPLRPSSLHALVVAAPHPAFAGPSRTRSTRRSRTSAGRPRQPRSRCAGCTAGRAQTSPIRRRCSTGSTRACTRGRRS